MIHWGELGWNELAGISKHQNSNSVTWISMLKNKKGYLFLYNVSNHF